MVNYGDRNMTKDQDFIKNIVKLVIVFVLFYNSYLFQYIPIFALHMDVKHISGSTNVMLSAFSNIIMCFILFFMYKKELTTEWKRFREKFTENIDCGFKYWSLGLVGMIISNLVLNLIFQAGQAANEQAVQKMITYLPWLMVINAGLLAPFIEEIVFRKTFKNVFHGKWTFILITGILFGLVHVIGNLNSFVDFLFIIPYGCLGISFAFCYYKTDTVFTSMFMHMFHNSVLVLLSILV